MITVCHFIAAAGDFIKHSSVLISVLRYQVPDNVTLEDTAFRNLKEIIKHTSNSVNYS